MKTKQITLLFFLLIAMGFKAFAQEVKITGKVLDENTKEPIFGAYISQKGIALSFSGDDGSFELILPAANMHDSITFSHIAYHNKTFILSELKPDNNMVTLSEKVVALAEITVMPEKQKRILKSAMKRFDDTYPKLDDLADVNYKQLISYMGKPRGYVEAYGSMLLRGRSKKSPILQNFIIPSQFRRTKEDPIVANIYRSTYPRIQIGPHCMNNEIPFEYCFYEYCHPLKSNLNRHYNFHLDSICTYKGITCYLFSFKQRKPITSLGWVVHGLSGQIWVNRDNFNLVKTSLAFNRNDLRSNLVIAEYAEKDNKIYPTHISITSVMNKYLTKTEPQKIVVECEIVFNKIYERPKKYKIGYQLECFVPELKYDRAFWVKHPITNKYFAEKLTNLIGTTSLDEAFELGAKEQTFEDNGKFVNQLYRKYSEKAVEIINNELKQYKE